MNNNTVILDLDFLTKTAGEANYLISKTKDISFVKISKRGKNLFFEAVYLNDQGVFEVVPETKVYKRPLCDKNWGTVEIWPYGRSSVFVNIEFTEKLFKIENRGKTLVKNIPAEAIPVRESRMNKDLTYYVRESYIGGKIYYAKYYQQQ